MNIQEYNELSNVTMADVFHANDSKSQRLLHAACGLVTETGELLEAIEKSIENNSHYLDPVNIKEELGDIAWYMAIDMREFNYILPLDSSEAFKPVKLSNLMLFKYAAKASIISSKIMDDLKRVTFYGKELLEENLKFDTTQKTEEQYLKELKDLKEFRKNHINKFNELSFYILQISNSFNLKFSDIFDTNIAKLQKRYGDKFDSFKALNRDLKAEYQVLSEIPVIDKTPKNSSTSTSVFNK